mgnify:CR=1 FL=1
MEVTDKLIEDLALLSRLHFSDAEKESIKKELKQMIEFVDKLGEVEVEGVEPLMHMSDATNRLREDEVKGSVSREEAMKNAPESDGIYFRVPKVINK